jgi:uncharacterized membrane protein YdbT with pleckstrin-like domain
MVKEDSDIKVDNTKKEISYGPSVFGRDILVSGENIIAESRPIVWPSFFAPVVLMIFGGLVTWLLGYFKQDILNIDLIEGITWFDTLIWWIGPAIIIIGFLSLLVRFLRWRYTIYALTDKRVLRRTGVFNRSYLDCSLSKVQNVEVRMSFISRIFRFGTIRIATARTKGEDIEWIDVKNPIALQRQINEALEKYNRENLRAS